MHAHLAHLHLLLRDAAVAAASDHDLPPWQALGRMYCGATLVEGALQGGIRRRLVAAAMAGDRRDIEAGRFYAITPAGRAALAAAQVATA